MTMNRNKILLVEDDTSLGPLLLDYLESEDYQVSWKRDGMTALDQLRKQAYDLCLLDIAMPGLDGFNLARQIKNQFKQLPFLFLTARSLKEDKLKAYELGAEDFITKPFDPDELACKLKVILRRKQQEHIPETMQVGQFTFHTSMQELTFGAKAIKLTEKENQILLMLSCNQNKIVRREDAVTRVYGKYDYFLGRSFDVFISRLRKILKDDPGIHIDNVFRVGFILRVEERGLRKEERS
ncbi:MAG TPA: response regulator transcription factor [Saprospiraceae bacterium]|nr:response regulator transcription factor [Saprospiraceae bacterium]